MTAVGTGGRATWRCAVLVPALALGILAPLASCVIQPHAARIPTDSAIAPGGDTRPAGAIEETTLTVYAAASLSEAFRAIGRAFSAEHPNVTVTFSFAGSQRLATQILEGAPADVFASANAAQMARVVDAGEVAAEAVVPFATNRLVIVYPTDNPAAITVPMDLARPGLKLVLAASDVPVGTYARTFLAKASVRAGFAPDFEAAVLANVVSNESDVQAVLAKVALGEADAGIVYASDASARIADRVGWVAIPDALNVVASYPIAPLARTPHPSLAAAFVAFVRSAEGQDVLAAHGFGAAP